MAPALLTTLLFALTAVCATQSALVFGPERANFGRLLMAVLLLGAWSHWFGQGFGGGQWPLFFLAGMIGFGAGGWCLFQAFPRIGSTLALLVVECAAALVALLLGWVVLGAGVSVSQGLFTLLILAGLVYALAPFQLPGGTRANLLTGVAFTALGALGQGISWVLTKAAFLNIQASGEELGHLTAAYQRLTGGFFLAGLIFVLLVVRSGKTKPTATRAAIPSFKLGWRAGLPWMVANALAGPVLGVSCMMWAIRSVGNPGLVQAIVATATLFSVPLARLTEKRRFRPNYFLGSALALGGVAGLLLFTPSRSGGEPVFDLKDFPVETSARDPLGPVLDGSLPAGAVGVAMLPLGGQLEEMPGLVLQSRGLNTIEPVLRGFSLDRLITSLEGIHLPLGAPTRTASPVNFFGPDPLLRVRLSGAYPPVSGGPVSTGGRIELTHESPPPGTVSSRFLGTLNPDGISFSLTASPFCPGAASVTASLHGARHGDYESGGAAHVVEADYAGWGLVLAGKAGIGQLGQLDWSARYARQELARNPSLPMDTRDADALYLTSRYAHQLGEAVLTAKLGLARIRPSLTSEDRPIAPGAPLLFVQARGEAKSVTTGLALQAPLDGGLSLQGGLDLTRQWRHATRQRFLVNGSSLSEAIWPDIRAEQPGLFLEVLSRDPSFSWRLGGRLEHARQWAAGQSARSDWTGQTHLVATWSLDDHWSLQAGLGLVRAAPGLGERFRTRVDALGGGMESGNPELDPETRRSISLALRFNRPGLALALEGWADRLDKFIQRQVLVPEPLLYSFMNRDARFHGWDIQARWVPFPERMEPLSLALDWSTVHGEDVATGQGLPDIPPWEGQISLLLRDSFSWGALQVQVGASVTGEGRNPRPDLEPIYVRSPAFVLWNLRGQVSLSSGWTLFAAAENLFDTLAYRYLQPPVAPGPVRPSGGSLIGGDRIPLPGRALRLGLERAF